ncbi:MAG: hypothetical protein ACYCZU_10035 [Devosia sp.]
MTMQTFRRLAGIVGLTLGLAGCIDVTMDIEVKSETEGKATTTSVMGADFYAMAKAGAASGEAKTEDGFCQEAGAQLTENADGSATCVLTVEGKFADLKLDEGDDGASFTVVSPGVVKVAFKTDDMKGELGTEGQDEQTKQMMQAFFEGRAITIRIRGKEVTDTNMTLSADKTSAEVVIPFIDLINGTIDLPDELYAVVKTN